MVPEINLELLGVNIDIAAPLQYHDLGYTRAVGLTLDNAVESLIGRDLFRGISKPHPPESRLLGGAQRVRYSGTTHVFICYKKHYNPVVETIVQGHEETHAGVFLGIRSELETLFEHVLGISDTRLASQEDFSELGGVVAAISRGFTSRAIYRYWDQYLATGASRDYFAHAIQPWTARKTGIRQR